MLFHPAILFLDINTGEICKCSPRDMLRNAYNSIQGEKLETTHMLLYAERISELHHTHITENRTAMKMSEQGTWMVQSVRQLPSARS